MVLLSYILLIIVAIAIGLISFWGYKRGMALSLIHLGSLIVSFVFAILLTTPISTLIVGTVLDNIMKSFSSDVVTTIFNNGEVKETIVYVASIAAKTIAFTIVFVIFNAIFTSLYFVLRKKSILKKIDTQNEKKSLKIVGSISSFALACILFIGLFGPISGMQSSIAKFSSNLDSPEMLFNEKTCEKFEANEAVNETLGSNIAKNLGGNLIYSSFTKGTLTYDDGKEVEVVLDDEIDKVDAFINSINKENVYEVIKLTSSIANGQTSTNYSSAATLFSNISLGIKNSNSLILSIPVAGFLSDTANGWLNGESKYEIIKNPLDERFTTILTPTLNLLSNTTIESLGDDLETISNALMAVAKTYDIFLSTIGDGENISNPEKIDLFVNALKKEQIFDNLTPKAMRLITDTISSFFASSGDLNEYAWVGSVVLDAFEYTMEDAKDENEYSKDLDAIGEIMSIATSNEISIDLIGSSLNVLLESRAMRKTLEDNILLIANSLVPEYSKLLNDAISLTISDYDNKHEYEKDIKAIELLLKTVSDEFKLSDLSLIIEDLFSSGAIRLTLQNNLELLTGTLDDSFKKIVEDAYGYLIEDYGNVSEFPHDIAALKAILNIAEDGFDINKLSEIIVVVLDSRAFRLAIYNNTDILASSLEGDLGNLVSSAIKFTIDDYKTREYSADIKAIKFAIEMSKDGFNIDSLSVGLEKLLSSSAFRKTLINNVDILSSMVPKEFGGLVVDAIGFTISDYDNEDEYNKDISALKALLPLASNGLDIDSLSGLMDVLFNSSALRQTLLNNSSVFSNLVSKDLGGLISDAITNTILDYEFKDEFDKDLIAIKTIIPLASNGLSMDKLSEVLNVSLDSNAMRKTLYNNIEQLAKNLSSEYGNMIAGIVKNTIDDYDNKEEYEKDKKAINSILPLVTDGFSIEGLSSCIEILLESNAMRKTLYINIDSLAKSISDDYSTLISDAVKFTIDDYSNEAEYKKDMDALKTILPIAAEGFDVKNLSEIIDKLMESKALRKTLSGNIDKLSKEMSPDYSQLITDAIKLTIDDYGVGDRFKKDLTGLKAILPLATDGFTLEKFVDILNPLLDSYALKTTLSKNAKSLAEMFSKDHSNLVSGYIKNVVIDAGTSEQAKDVNAIKSIIALLNSNGVSAKGVGDMLMAVRDSKAMRKICQDNVIEVKTYLADMICEKITIAENTKHLLAEIVSVVINDMDNITNYTKDVDAIKAFITLQTTNTSFIEKVALWTVIIAQVPRIASNYTLAELIDLLV